MRARINHQHKRIAYGVCMCVCHSLEVGWNLVLRQRHLTPRGAHRALPLDVSATHCQSGSRVDGGGIRIGKYMLATLATTGVIKSTACSLMSAHTHWTTFGFQL